MSSHWGKKIHLLHAHVAIFFFFQHLIKVALKQSHYYQNLWKDPLTFIKKTMGEMGGGSFD